MISKSSFVRFMHCSKDLWLYLNKKDLMSPLSAIDEQNIKNGIIVGELARKYFPDTVSAQKISGKGLDYDKQVEFTKDFLKNNIDCIAEASFKYDNLFCAVDLLKKDGDGYSIYEVKSNKEVEDTHYYDVAFQKYVLEKCGLKINHIYLMHINGEYIKHGDLDLKQYFKPECLDTHPTVLATYQAMDTYLPLINKLFELKEEPQLEFDDKRCKKKDCPFYCCCHKDIPPISILLLNGRGLKKKEALLAKGIITIDDLVGCHEVIKLSDLNEVQINCFLNNKQVHVDKAKLSEFLNSLKYPIYHLDFETTNYIVPQLDGMRPHEEFPFQYSLHIEDKPGHIQDHKAYLADKMDCIKEIAKRLYDDIPDGSTVLAFYASVEKRFIKYLADKCPEYKERLLSYKIVDLYKPFANGYYYNTAQGDSCSIKQVMPAVVPEHANAYQELPGVHNGAEALSIFDIMLNQKGEERKKTREGMLEYCKLDTLSMVWILNKLWDIVNS